MQRNLHQIFEDKTLQMHARGCFEEQLTAIDNAVADNVETFGENAILFATFPKYAIVVNEGGKFFSAKYTYSNDKVRFYKTESLDVPVVSVDSASKDAVESFLKGDSISENLRSLVKTSLASGEQALEEMRNILKGIFAKGKTWKRFVSENRAKMAQFAFDPEYGSPRIEVESKFEDLYGDEIEESELEGSRGDVVSSLAKIEERTIGLQNVTSEAYEKYIAETGDNHEREDDQILTQFESFADNYLNYIDEVNDFIIANMNTSKTSCVACLALVHDEIAKQVEELELGSRLIRKISAKFLE